MLNLEAEYWRDNAACAEDPNDTIFFQDGLKRNSRAAAVEAAKQICEKCPVIRECREYALKNPEKTEYGVWGGLSELERRAIRRRGGAAIRKALESVTSEKTSP